MNASVRRFRLASALALCVLCLSLTACSSYIQPPGDSDGIGGTGVVADNGSDGIGGTGKVDSVDPGDGVGGTGLWADVGDVALFGVITSVEPLVINGHGMLVDDATVYTLNGAPVDAEQVSVGGVAWVKAGFREHGIFADEIALQLNVGGIVTGINLAKGELEVLGQTIQAGAQTKLIRKSIFSGDGEEQANVDSGIELLAIGDWVEVAGLRDSTGRVRATLVVAQGADEVPHKRIGFVNGIIISDENGRHHIGALELPASVTSEHNARRVVISGRYEGREFVTASSVTSPSLPFAGEVSAYSVQGYFSGSVPASGTQRFGGLNQRLVMTAEIAASTHKVDSNKPVVLEFKTTSNNELEVLDLKPSEPQVEHQMLIPKYTPALPNGEFSAIRRMQQPTTNPIDAIPVDNGVDRTSIVPSSVPSGRAVRLPSGDAGTPNLRPDLSLNPGPDLKSIEAPIRAPVIQAPVSSDVVRPPQPAAQTATGAIGPR